MCQGSEAHFTRTGNSQTPENAASLPSSGAAFSAAFVGSEVEQLVEALEEGFGFGAALADEGLGHHRGRRGGDRATSALEGHALHDVVLDQEVDRDLVAAQRVEALGLVARLGQGPEVSRPLGVIEDHFLVELPKLAAHANISRTRKRPFTSASSSSRVLKQAREARAVAGSRSGP